MKTFSLDENEQREHFAWFTTIPTRWNDNDQYGHVNNVVYYNFFELAIMKYLIEASGLDVVKGSSLAFTAENGCRYHRSVQFPQEVDCGLRVVKIGNSSVRYELGVFVQGDEKVAATGFVVDVFVDSQTELPVSSPVDIKQALQHLVV